MKVLFVCSGNKDAKPGTVVKNQAESLKASGIDIGYFLIKGKGFKGYLRNVWILKKYLKNKKWDLIHSHYSLSAFVATMALYISSNSPHVVSLMGSDAKLMNWSKLLVIFCHQVFWNNTIVKSKRMLKDLKIKDATIIPNGVEISKIRNFENNQKISSNNKEADKTKKTILFAANPANKVKNFQLAEASVQMTDAFLKVIYNKSHEEVLKEILEADILLLTSHWEGSPNIIKEAMACNCPIVSTNVGDVEWLFGDEPGHYITSFHPEDVAVKIQSALKYAEYQGKTNGRERLIQLGLDSDTVAKKIIQVYKEVINNRKES